MNFKERAPGTEKVWKATNAVDHLYDRAVPIAPFRIHLEVNEARRVESIVPKCVLNTVEKKSH
jgi:hypothetical protein